VTPLRLAVIGTGHLGRIHARLAKDLDGATLVAVCDPSEPARQQTAAETGATPLADYQDLVGQVDAVIVAAPTDQHYAIGSELASRGLHLLVEKPLTSTLAEADTLVEHARRHNVVLQAGHVERFNAALQLAADHLHDPKYIEARRLSGYPFRSTDIGVVMDLMIHDLDIVLSITGAAVRRVDALGVSVLGCHEDVAQARLEFNNGCVANLTASRVSYATCRQLQAWTDSGFAALDFATGGATVVEPNDEVLQRRFEVAALPEQRRSYLKEHLFDHVLARRTLSGEPVNALAAEQRDFVHSIRTGQAPRVPGSAGRDAIALAERILDAIDRHAWDGDPQRRVGTLGQMEQPILPGPHWHTTTEQDHPRREAG